MFFFFFFAWEDFALRMCFFSGRACPSVVEGCQALSRGGLHHLVREPYCCRVQSVSTEVGGIRTMVTARVFVFYRDWGSLMYNMQTHAGPKGGESEADGGDRSIDT